MNGEIDTSVVYEHCMECTTPVMVEQGSSRSGKTFNILYWIIIQCLAADGWRKKVITICRKTFPSLKGTVYRDFINILADPDYGLEIYNSDNHNKTDHIYMLNTNLIEFVAVDQPEKIRGRKRHICFINEGNDLKWEDFVQLKIRTSERIVIDFNPSDEFHWLYDKVIPSDDCTFHKTTYKDNPFLTPEEVKNIEWMRDIDEWHWQVYGMGERARLRDAIFENWSEVSRIPENATLKGYGLDFGWHPDPVAVVQVWEIDNDLFVKEILYQTHLNNQELAAILKELNVRGVIACDEAEPKSISVLKSAGLSAIGVKKGPDSVRASIDLLKQRRIFITSDSVNLLKEIRQYKWRRDKNGDLVGKGEPVKAMDHTIDALRYWALDALKHKARGKYTFA